MYVNTCTWLSDVYGNQNEIIRFVVLFFLIILIKTSMIVWGVIHCVDEGFGRIVSIAIFGAFLILFKIK